VNRKGRGSAAQRAPVGPVRSIRSRQEPAVFNFPASLEQRLVRLKPKPPVIGDDASPRAITMNFLEGARIVTLDGLRDNDITRYQVTKFYQEQIRKSAVSAPGVGAASSRRASPTLAVPSPSARGPSRPEQSCDHPPSSGRQLPS
jgi:hypothetical protein